MYAPEQNPYDAPQCGEAPAKITHPVNLAQTWRIRCLAGLAATVVGFGGTMLYPAELLFGNLLLMLPLMILNLAMYVGPVVTIISAFFWFIRSGKRRVETSP